MTFPAGVTQKLLQGLALRTALPDLFSSSGRIGFRGRDSGTRIRNIRIRELPDSATDWAAKIPVYDGPSTDVIKPVLSEMPTWQANDSLDIPNLRAYWSFNEGEGRLALDGTQYANHGWLDGEPDAVRWSGESAPTKYKNSSALRFSEKNGWLDVGQFGGPDAPNAGLIGNQGTFSVWMKSDHDQRMSLWRVTNRKNMTDVGCILNTTEPESLGFKIRYHDSKPNNFYNHGFSHDVCDGQWHHLAVAWHDIVVPHTRFYVDGVQQERRYFNGGSRGWPNAFSRFDTSLKLGCWTNAKTGENSTFFEGLLDEVRFYSRPLTEAEIQQLADRNATATQ